MYMHAIFPGNPGFPTLQSTTLENIIFPAFCGKYERKWWHVFI